ncbi:MAG: hypothetical protein ISQ90_05190, partial [Rhodospirillales bacterium]|nr:hypothetical protein [Rhodospirillales bacterium]
TLTSTNNNDGRNTSLVRSDISYKFDGKKVDLFNTKKYTQIPALAELNASDFNGFENSFRKENYRINKVINLKFDLDSDGKNEEFYCPFWERWGLLNGCSIISEKYGNILKAPQCKRLGVLSEKKNGWHILVVDFNERWFFDLQSNQYQPITKRTKK